jgi:hypothetical protein
LYQRQEVSWMAVMFVFSIVAIVHLHDFTAVRSLMNVFIVFNSNHNWSLFSICVRNDNMCVARFYRRHFYVRNRKHASFAPDYAIDRSRITSQSPSMVVDIAIGCQTGSTHQKVSKSLMSGAISFVLRRWHNKSLLQTSPTLVYTFVLLRRNWLILHLTFFSFHSAQTRQLETDQSELWLELHQAMVDSV